MMFFHFAAPFMYSTAGNFWSLPCTYMCRINENISRHFGRDEIYDERSDTCVSSGQGKTLAVRDIINIVVREGDNEIPLPPISGAR